MDPILELKQKYNSTSKVENINQLFSTFKTHAEKICQEESEHLAEEEKKIKEMKEKLQEQQEKIYVEEQKLKSLIKDLSNHNEILKELEIQNSKLLAENHEAEAAKSQMQIKLMKPNLTDEKLLVHGRRTLDYYKVLTGVRWDYPKLKTSIKGYVTNHENHVYPFCYDHNDNSVESKLWKEIEKSVGALKNIRLSEHKENSDPKE